MPITVDLLANDIAGTNAIDPTTVVLSNIDVTLSVVNNGDGTVDITGTAFGIKTFDYTVDDVLGNTSNSVTVSVTVKAIPVLPNTVGGLVEWLNPADIPAQTTGTTLSAWPADTGNSGTVVSDPLYIVDAFGAGLPGVEWDGDGGGAGQYVTFGDPFGVAPTIGWCIFMVYQNYGQIGNQAALMCNTFGAAGANQLVLFADNGSGDDVFAVFDGLNMGPGFPIDGLKHIVTFHHTGTDFNIYDGSVIKSTIANTDSELALATWFIGANGTAGGYNGLIGDIAMYNVALDEFDVLNIIEGFKDKYGL